MWFPDKKKSMFFHVIFETLRWKIHTLQQPWLQEIGEKWNTTRAGVLSNDLICICEDWKEVIWLTPSREPNSSQYFSLKAILTQYARTNNTISKNFFKIFLSVIVLKVVLGTSASAWYFVHCHVVFPPWKLFPFSQI